MSPQNMILTGILLITLVGVEYGGLFLKRVVERDVPANELQRSFYRAGHAHAAVLVILSIAIASIIDQAHLSGVLDSIARLGVPFAAILMPAGFFLSVTGENPAKPNRLVALLWIGAVSLTAGVLTSGIGLLVAGIQASRT
jgi:hypothetical protein